MNERKIQSIVSEYLYSRGSKIVVPNIYHFGNPESDLLSVNRENLITEIEIKCSKWDYQADFKKAEKHENLESQKDLSLIPSYFIYACPAGMIDKEEVPHYAGLIYVKKHRNGQYFCKSIKKTPRLHGNEISCFEWEEISRKLAYRLWD